MYHSFSRTLALGASCTDRSGRVAYSNGLVRFGESTNSGTWGGAGTNGGVNFAVLDASCALLAYRESEVFSLFAGVHVIGFTGRLNGDIADVSDRGSNFAARFNTNPNGSAAYAWAESLNNVGGGGDCKNQRNQVIGGGHGINGCGMNEALALETSQAAANGKIQEPWNMLSEDFRDSLGNAFWSEVMTCNWDCINNDGAQ